jgi:NAD-dependent deacetylase
MKKKIVVLTGAGISAESGIKTFRDADGLWENHRVEDVATPEAFERDPALVLEFYNQRRRQLLTCQPNAGHMALVELERNFEVQIITQNVDDLHERAGSSRVMHLHGELKKVRSTRFPKLIYERTTDVVLGDLCERGAQLRPHIVWFGEAVPMLQPAAELTSQADILLVVGTSLQVYPAAGLMAYADIDIPVYYIDPAPQVNYALSQMSQLIVVEQPASTGLPYVAGLLTTK